MSLTTRLSPLLPLLALSACAPEDGALTATETDGDQLRCQPDLDGGLPDDVAADGTAADFDCFSWQTFAAISQPTDGSGVADPARPLASTLPDAETRVVWDDWSNKLPVSDAAGQAIRLEVSLNETTFDQAIAAGLESAETHREVDSVAFSCAGDDDGAMTVKAAWMVLDAEQAASGRYYTRTAAVYIQPALNSANFAEDGTAIEDPLLAACEQHTVGLVGVNIGRKTRQQARWIWSAFEHVDNAPDCAADGATACGARPPWSESDNAAYSKLSANNCPASIDQDYNFLSADAELTGDCDCNIPPVSNATDDPTSGAYYVDAASPLEPARVCRATPIEEETAALDALWHEALGDSVWANYELVGTQWASDGSEQADCATPYEDVVAEPDAIAGAGELPPEDAGLASPEVLANVSMETWSQDSSSCVGCHSGAFLQGSLEDATHASADFSWWLNAAVPAAD